MLSMKSWCWSMTITPLLFLMTVTSPVNLKLLNLSMDTLLALIRPSSGKSCDLYPLPGSLPRACLSELGPILTQIVNQSLQSAVVSEQLKVAMVKHLMKKPSLDHREFKKIRVISNLQFLGKIMEKVVADKVINYLDDNNLQEVYQSAYKRRNRTSSHPQWHFDSCW